MSIYSTEEILEDFDLRISKLEFVMEEISENIKAIEASLDKLEKINKDALIG